MSKNTKGIEAKLFENMNDKNIQLALKWLRKTKGYYLFLLPLFLYNAAGTF